MLTAPEPEGIGCEAKGRNTLELPVFCVVDVGAGREVVAVVDSWGVEEVEDEDVVVDGVGVGVFWASSCRRMG